MSSTTFIIDIFSGVYAAGVLDSDTWNCPVFEWKIRPKKQKHRLQRDANEQNCPWESLKREAEGPRYPLVACHRSEHQKTADTVDSSLTCHRIERC
jgi:hypothetical protein